MTNTFDTTSGTDSLSSDWGALTTCEADLVVCKAIEFLRKTAGRPAPPIGERVRAADSQCTLTSLLTARSFAASASVNVASDPNIPVREGDLALVRDRCGALWWKFRALRPAHFPVAKEHLQCLYPDASHVLLPLNKGIGELLVAYLELHGASGKKLRDKDFRFWLAELDPTGRIHEPMISGFLPQRMLQAGMDIARTAAVFGLTEIGEGSRAHYYSLPLATAQQHYCDVLAEFLPTLAPTAAAIRTAEAVDESPWIGAAAQLRPERIVECLKNLRDSATAKASDTPADVCRKHNALVAYTCLGLLLACAGRVRDFPLERYSFSREGSLAILDDKIAPDLASARLLAIPENVKRQVGTTTHHCRIARGIFRPLDGEVQGEIYFVNSELSLVPVTAASLQRVVDGFSPIPVKAFRRHVATALISMGVPPDAVDFTTGHSAFGQEPHRQTSTLEYDAQCRHLGVSIAGLLDSLRFVPIRSWLAGAK